MLQKQRLMGVDLARGLAVFFMICVHVLEVYANPAVQASVFGKVIAFLGGPPAAPVFMMLMGLSFAYSSKKDLRSGIIRGIKVFISGYVLNLARGVIPVFLVKMIDPIAISGMTAEQSNLLNIFLVADILQFAGIALIIMAVLRELNVSRLFLVSAAIIISMISPFLWGNYTDIPILSQFIDLFVGDKAVGGFVANMVNFPVFPWLAFPLIGMAVGLTFAKTENLEKTYRKSGILGLGIMLAGIAVVITNPEYHYNDYYHSRQGYMIFMAGFVLLWLYICHLLASTAGTGRIFGIFYDWSKNVTTIYFIQWVLMTWFTALFGMNSSTILPTVLIMLFMIVASHFINKVYQKINEVILQSHYRNNV